MTIIPKCVLAGNCGQPLCRVWIAKANESSRSGLLLQKEISWCLSTDRRFHRSLGMSQRLLLQFRLVPFSTSPHTAKGRLKHLCAARSYGNKSQGQIACDFLLACLAGSVHHCLSADVARFQVKPVMSHSYSQSAAFAALACYSPSSGVQSIARTFSAAGCTHSPGTGHLELV